MKKHAYLVVAHNQFELLSELLMCIDSEHNDIYLHIDKKANVDISVFQKKVTKGKLYISERVSVSWGAYSLIKVTLMLLEMATGKRHYEYYHLLSGQDFPLVSQQEIYSFFEREKGKEFIGWKELDNYTYIRRIKYFYPFQELFGGRTVVNGILRKVGRGLQRFLCVNRMKKSIYKKWGIGSNWFSITDDLARYVVSQKKNIKKSFSMCFCGDEIFLQTVFLNSPYYDEIRRYHSGQKDHKYIQDIYLDIKRAIDWTRGNPYIFDENDFKMLQESGCLFARKMDWNKSRKLIELIKKNM